MHPLEDSYLRVERAKEHYDALHAEIVKWWQENSEPFPVSHTVNAETGEEVFEFPKPPVFPKRWGILVGEVCDSARAALDYLVYALAIKGGGNPDADKTMFPIFTSKTRYLKPIGSGKRKISRRDKYLAGVQEPWREKIDAVQPYHRKNGAGGRRADMLVRDDPLVLIREITNWQKHRRLRSVGVVFKTPAYTFYRSGTDEFVTPIKITYNLRSPRQPDFTAEAGAKRGWPPVGVTHLVPEKCADVDQRCFAGLAFGEHPWVWGLTSVEQAVGFVDFFVREFEPAFAPFITPSG